MNQNCNYGMDDANRLASVNCAGSWGQSFHYDAFGNIQKLGLGSGTTMTSTYMAGVAPTLGYSALSNRVVQGATATPARMRDAIKQLRLQRWRTA